MHLVWHVSLWQLARTKMMSLLVCKLKQQVIHVGFYVPLPLGSQS